MIQPQHIAIIMDGNGRWAQARNKPRSFGHKKGVSTLKDTVKRCAAKNISALTVYAFSSENWQRPEDEVNLLMELFITALKNEVDDLHKNNVRLFFIGDRSAFPQKLQQGINESESKTCENTGLRLNVAANYGGHWDIAQACRKVAERVAKAEITPQQINEKTIAEFISLSDQPNPDLFIRTGGERRISNYLLWQLAYSELYFTDTLWPDFDEAELDSAIDWFQQRERRFGRTQEQVKKHSA